MRERREEPRPRDGAPHLATLCRLREWLLRPRRRLRRHAARRRPRPRLRPAHAPHRAGPARSARPGRGRRPLREGRAHRLPGGRRGRVQDRGGDLAPPLRRWIPHHGNHRLARKRRCLCEAAGPRSGTDGAGPGRGRLGGRRVARELRDDDEAVPRRARGRGGRGGRRPRVPGLDRVPADPRGAPRVLPGGRGRVRRRRNHGPAGKAMDPRDARRLHQALSLRICSRTRPWAR